MLIMIFIGIKTWVPHHCVCSHARPPPLRCFPRHPLCHLRLHLVRQCHCQAPHRPGHAHALQMLPVCPTSSPSSLHCNFSASVLATFPTREQFWTAILGMAVTCTFRLVAMDTFMLDVMTYKPLLSRSLLEIKLHVLFLDLMWRSSHRVWANWMILPSNWEKQMLKGKLAVQKMVVNLMDSVCEGWDREYLHTQSLCQVFLNQMLFL